MDAAQEKYLQMTQQPVEKLVCRLAVPSILSMMVSAFYNMADTFFIGKISTQATGAVGVVFSYMALIQAIGFFFGHGSGNYISRALGRRQRDSAAVMAANGFFFCLGCGFVIMAGVFLFMDPMLRALGATETILPEARAYFRWILLASPVMMGTFVLNNQMRLQGNARRGMIGVMSGAVLNILLDPLLIFGFELGIAGAAIATAFSQLVGFCLLVWLSGRGDGLRPALKDFSPSLRAFKEIAAGGLPSLGRQGLASLATAYLNQAAGVWGDSAIAAFSVVNRITFMAFSALLGFGQGFQPVCGFNYGAGLYGRVKKAFWFCVKASFLLLCAMALVGLLFAEPLVAAFRDSDAQLIEIGARALRCQALSFPLLGWITMVNMTLQTARKTRQATIVAISRQGIVFIPVLFIATRLWGLWGVILAQPLSDLFSFFLAIPLARGFLRSLDQPPAQTS